MRKFIWYWQFLSHQLSIVFSVNVGCCCCGFFLWSCFFLSSLLYSSSLPESLKLNLSFFKITRFELWINTKVCLNRQKKKLKIHFYTLSLNGILFVFHHGLDLKRKSIFRQIFVDGVFFSLVVSLCRFYSCCCCYYFLVHSFRIFIMLQLFMFSIFKHVDNWTKIVRKYDDILMNSKKMKKKRRKKNCDQKRRKKNYINRKSKC